MGRGIAVVFAYAGHPVTLVDFKPRSDADFEKLEAEALGEIRGVLDVARRLRPVRCRHRSTRIVARVSIVPESGAQAAFSSAAVIFEGVPEVLDLKREALARVVEACRPVPDHRLDHIDHSGRRSCPARSSIRSASSTRTGSTRPILVPLVEVSPGAHTDPAVTARLKALLEGIGKVPVVCAARPGYIVPRIQALAMNEAARMVEEGVATAEDLDKAIKYGFGFRFAVLGMLEFIDWGGGDILYYASRYLTKALGQRALRRTRDRRAQHGKAGHSASRPARVSQLREYRSRRPSRAKS